MALNNSVQLAPKLQTGTGRFSAAGLSAVRKLMVLVSVTAIGATPTMTYTIQGSNDGTNWADLELVVADSATAASKAAVTVTTVSVAQYFVDGLDKRFFDQYAMNVTANTNVTFNGFLYIPESTDW